jgi:hypothetical protein
MLVYLVRMTHRPTQKQTHKSGHSKQSLRSWRERFKDSEYDDFDIELLAGKEFSHKNWTVAKAVAITIENAFRAVWPAKESSFMIEEYFGVEPGSMKISGVTELTFLKDNQTEKELINTFNSVVNSLNKTSKELERLN